MGKAVQTNLAAFHSCWRPTPAGLLPLCHCPQLYWWSQFGRLHLKLGRRGEQLGPDWACELRFRKAKTGVRWARWKLADKGKGARKPAILSHSSGKPAVQKRQGLEQQLCTRHWEAEAASVLFTEAQTGPGTEKWANRK